MKLATPHFRASGGTGSRSRLVLKHYQSSAAVIARAVRTILRGLPQRMILAALRAVGALSVCVSSYVDS